MIGDRFCNFAALYRPPNQSQDEFETSHNFEMTLETLAQKGYFVTTVIGDLRILIRKKAPSNKIPALTKSRNMDIYVVSTSNQLFIRGSSTNTKFSKNKVVAGKTPFFVTGPFCTHHSTCLNIGF